MRLEVLVAAENREAPEAERYRPCQVYALVRLYRYLHDAKPPVDPEMAEFAQRVLGPGGWREEAMSKRIDVDRAAAHLAIVDTELFEAFLGLREDETATTTAKWIGISVRTLGRRRTEAIIEAARFLNGDPDPVPCCRRHEPCPV